MARRNNIGSDKTMSIMGHLHEFRTRLTVSAFVLVAGAVLAYVFRDQIIGLLMAPLGGRGLMYLNPAGGFSFILLVSIYAGLALATPIIVYNLYAFLRPALPVKIQRYSAAMLIASSILMVAGVTFGYIFAIPGALNFLYEFAGDYVTAELTADSYLNFIVAYTLGLGLVFQLPLLLLIFHWIKPQTPSGLVKSERWVIVLAFVAAAIITPTPDPLNQVIIALPIVLVYQLGVAAVLMSIYRQRIADKRQARKLAVVAPTVSEIPTLPQQLQPSRFIEESIMDDLAPDPKPALVAGKKGHRQRSLDGFDLMGNISNPGGQIQSRSLTKPAPRPNSTLRSQPRGGLSVDGIYHSA